MPKPSNMIPLGAEARAFSLLDSRTNKMVSFPDQQLKVATVIMFICNHCPYVQHILPKLIEIANLYQARDVSFFAINSNDANTYPEDSFQNMSVEAQKKQFPFPYLYDDTQSTAKAYQAACTPDFYIFDKNERCAYHGRFDGSTPGNKEPVTGADLSQALDHLIADQPVPAENQKPSLGCSIKWFTENTA
jgi:thiol-disulfide isomerase/thioredoxin